MTETGFILFTKFRYN